MIMAGRSEAAYAPILSLVVLLAHSRSPVSYLTWYYARKVSTKINNWMGNKIFKKKLEYRIIDLISVSVCFFFIFFFFVMCVRNGIYYFYTCFLWFDVDLFIRYIFFCTRFGENIVFLMLFIEKLIDVP